VIERLRKIKDTNGSYIWQGRNTPATEAPRDYIYGYPIYEQNDLSSDELYFGAWRNYIIGDRKQLYIATTTSTETAWTQDAYDMKAVEMVDGRMLFAGAFAKANNF
jgi:HK97 family phage major capsid protein